MEQSAYQDLLKLRGTSSSRLSAAIANSRAGQQSASFVAKSAGSSNWINWTWTGQEQNQYETQRGRPAAAGTGREPAAAGETGRYRIACAKLAQRQEDLNRQMRELQSALEKGPG